MNIITATKTQLPIIQKLAHEIWPKTYSGIISDGQITYMLEMMYSIFSLEKQLETRPFLLVEDQGEYIGFASYEINVEHSSATKIHKIYVLPQTQGKGIGRQLIHHIAEIARKHDNTTLQLTVNKNNNARFFYEKLGFSVIEQAVFDIGNGYIMDDYIMEKPI